MDGLVFSDCAWRFSKFGRLPNGWVLSTYIDISHIHRVSLISAGPRKFGRSPKGRCNIEKKYTADAFGAG